MSELSKKLRSLAKFLREKQGDTQIKPQPIPNPVGSHTKGDLGSLDLGNKNKKTPSFVPKIRKNFVPGTIK